MPIDSNEHGIDYPILDEAIYMASCASNLSVFWLYLRQNESLTLSTTLMLRHKLRSLPESRKQEKPSSCWRTPQTTTDLNLKSCKRVTSCGRSILPDQQVDPLRFLFIQHSCSIKAKPLYIFQGVGSIFFYQSER